MDILKSWIINICSTVLFITAIELILPNNTMKKYGKFVLGLILMTVVINPIFKIMNKDKENLTWNIEKSEKILSSFEEDKEYYKKKNVESTMENFKKNLQTQLNEVLLKKYPKDKFQIDASLEYENNNISLKSVQVKVEDKSVSKIKKIELNANTKVDSDTEELVSDKQKEIRSYLSSILGLDESNIKVIR
ncbi:stage III sporulation protein AF [Clostridium amazonitimonense]|uniref:stage III sporulation protein AF n=1 Tax=Clostridium amazonitimonense TaxID=1499689 RepID=UPI0005097FA1|nr:stage III sporulation protein AF [Clostridium amazonitimonense]